MSRPVGQLDMFSFENMLFGGQKGGGQMGLLSTSTDSGSGNKALTAIQRRALQLKKWQEYEEMMARQPPTSPVTPLTPSNVANINNNNNNKTLSERKKKIRSTKVRFSNDTLFLAACVNGDLEECRRLLSEGTNIDCTNIDGMTAMHQACIDGNLEVVKFLIDNGADINAVDNDGWTPLHAAANCGHVEVAEALLDAGADPRAVNTDGELATDIAETEEVEELIQKRLHELNPTNVDLEELRKQELHVMEKDVNNWIKTGRVEEKPHPRTGATLLHVAASKGYASVVQVLLSNTTLRGQIDVDSLDHEKWTPLAAACYFNQPAVVEILLENGADSNFKTPGGQSLDDLSAGHEDIVKLLETHRKKKKEEEEKKEKERQERIKLMSTPSKPPQPPSIQPPSTPSTPTPSEGRPSTIPTSPSSALTAPSSGATESETQRKAHAKRVRETRRSTQGISADDVSRAKDQIQKQKQQFQATVATSTTDSSSSIPHPTITSSSAPTTTLTSSSSTSSNGTIGDTEKSSSTSRSNGVTHETGSSCSASTSKTPPASSVVSVNSGDKVSSADLMCLPWVISTLCMNFHCFVWKAREFRLEFLEFFPSRNSTSSFSFFF